MKEGKVVYFSEDGQGVLWVEKRLVVLKVDALRKKILNEAHDSLLSIHPRTTKIYQDLKPRFWWTRMKRGIARYVAECNVS